MPILSEVSHKSHSDPITKLQIELANMNYRGRALYTRVFSRETIIAALDLLDGVEEYRHIPTPAGTPEPTLELARDLFCMMAAEADEADEADLAGCA